MILFSHPSGNANVRHAALALHRAGLLGEYWTSFHYDAPGWLGKLLPKGMRESLLRRSYPQELHRKIVARPAREATRLLARRVGLGALTCEDGVARSLDRQVAQRLRQAAFHAVYAYEESAEASFATARELKQVTLYDQPHGYWRAARRILDEEAQLQPDWAPTLPNGCRDEARAARRDAELGLADVVIVPSTFTRRTLEKPGLTRARIAVIPYGTPHAPGSFNATAASPSKRLRVLFAGPLTQQHGLSYLFGAMRQLGGDAELTVVGRRGTARCPALDQALAAAGVRHVNSIHQGELFRQMAQHDVLVYPSLFDGFGSTMLEAMSLGLPVIATPHTAAPDLITDGVEGHVVPIRSADALAEKLATLHRDPATRTEMGRRAQQRAGEFTWRRYETTLSTRIREALSLAGHGTSPSFSPPVPEPQLPGVFPRPRG